MDEAIRNEIREHLGVDWNELDDNFVFMMTKSDLAKILEEIWYEGRQSAFTESQ